MNKWIRRIGMLVIGVIIMIVITSLLHPLPIVVRYPLDFFIGCIVGTPIGILWDRMNKVYH